MNEPLWTREQVAEYLNVAVTQVDRWRGLLPEPIFIGRWPRWKPEDVRAWTGTKQKPSRNPVSVPLG